MGLDDPALKVELFSAPAPAWGRFSATAEAEAEAITSAPFEEEPTLEVIITFDELPSAQEIEVYRADGTELGQYIDGTSYYATTHLGALRREAAQDESILSIAVPPLEHKIHPELLMAQPSVAEGLEENGGDVEVTAELTGSGTFEEVAATVEALDGEVIEVSRALGHDPGRSGFGVHLP